MTDYVQIFFGGYKACTWATFQAVIQTYYEIATQYGLLKSGLHFSWNKDIPNEITGVYFNYEKPELAEDQLQVFNTTWKGLAVQYSFTRQDTTIRYFQR